ncbi:methionyl-tRNA synthetase [Mucilaginibacter sp. UYP25]|uniref:hypothetical protein n=1 Tax=unclassified Mucilaginibacter TaxID=2617802 RepID=UPI003397BA54
MKYNPTTKELFTNEGLFLKKLHCPLSKQWEELSQTDLLKGKMCDHCQSTVHDTSLFKDDELLSLLKSNEHTCLKVDLNQPNLTITYKTNER